MFMATSAKKSSCTLKGVSNAFITCSSVIQHSAVFSLSMASSSLSSTLLLLPSLWWWSSTGDGMSSWEVKHSLAVLEHSWKYSMLQTVAQMSLDFLAMNNSKAVCHNELDVFRSDSSTVLTTWAWKPQKGNLNHFHHGERTKDQENRASFCDCVPLWLCIALDAERQADMELVWMQDDWVVWPCLQLSCHRMCPKRNPETRFFQCVAMIHIFLDFSFDLEDPVNHFEAHQIYDLMQSQSNVKQATESSYICFRRFSRGFIWLRFTYVGRNTLGTVHCVVKRHHYQFVVHRLMKPLMWESNSGNIFFRRLRRAYFRIVSKWWDTYWSPNPMR